MNFKTLLTCFLITVILSGCGIIDKRRYSNGWNLNIEFHRKSGKVISVAEHKSFRKKSLVSTSNTDTNAFSELLIIKDSTFVPENNVQLSTKAIPEIKSSLKRKLLTHKSNFNFLEKKSAINISSDEKTKPKEPEYYGMISLLLLILSGVLLVVFATSAIGMEALTATIVIVLFVASLIMCLIANKKLKDQSYKNSVYNKGFFKLARFLLITIITVAISLFILIAAWLLSM